jgi:hypothetical protein
MGYVPYVGFATHHRATVKIRLYFKRLMFMKCFVKKKKNGWSQQMVSKQLDLGFVRKVEV